MSTNENKDKKAEVTALQAISAEDLSLIHI